MKFPIEWLKDLVSFRAGSDQLAEMLTMGGLETVILPGEVLEIDVLPNRSDCWSIRGIAREVSALTKFKMKPVKFMVKESSKRIFEAVKVEVKDKNLCPRYMARVIENVKIGGSPAWLKARLEKAGIRSINNVVDVTNYLLLELGQPMHAFDAELVANQTILVRRAKHQEKIKTLDGKEYALASDMLVIADTEKAIALAGVMGGGNTEVSGRTQTVVLESAYFDPILIHKTAKALKVRTEASVRFEHGVDWKTVEEALDRGASMIAEFSGGNILRGKIDEKAKEKKPVVVSLRPERVNQLLGTNMPASEMSSILKRLGFSVKGKKVIIPLFRAADIYREIDLIEEIARIYGYGRIEATMPNTSFFGKEEDKEDNFRNKVRNILTGCGFNEAQTYSMVGPKDFEKCGLDPASAIKIDNPMNIEESLMRTKLLPGLLNVVAHNLNRQIDNIFIFEIGKIFAPSSGKLPIERWALTAVATGDYSSVKGALDNLCSALGVELPEISASNDHLLQPGRGGSVAGLGLIGELHPDIRKKYGIEKPVAFFGIDLENLFKMVKAERRYKPLPKFPSVSRDISMFISKETTHRMIVETIRKAGGELVENVFPFDKYKESVAYRVVYRNAEKTLTEDEVNTKHQGIVDALVSKLMVKIRQ